MRYDGRMNAMNQTYEPVPFHKARIVSGFEKAKEGLIEIAKGLFKWFIIIGATLFILF
jgi:hypothetical protein